MNGALFKAITRVLCTLQVSALYADCVGIMNIANHPSIIDSTCSVPFKKVVIELNYINERLINHAGTQQNYPNAELRIGLPAHNEIIVLLPNYIQQSTAPTSGSSAAIAGMKHSINYNEKWAFAIEVLANTASGSYYFGSQHWGATVNGIASYSITQKLNLEVQLGISRISEARAVGGRYFNSFNPDVVLSYAPFEKLSFYSEIYAQTKIDASQGAGVNFDGGMLLLVSKNTVLNFSIGQQLYNYLGGFEHYVNAGISVML
jgi:hypothetical protein